MRPFLAATLSLLCLQSPLVAQHDHAGSPYAHTQSAEIPTLTDEEIAQLRNGDGMGLARAAELNGYPGPKHTLELREQLALDVEQRRELATIRSVMADAAIAKGEEILRAEQQLAEIFESGTATRVTVAQLTQHLGALRGHLQVIHLNAHIETTRVLTPRQINEYAELRGYIEGGRAPGS